MHFRTIARNLQTRTQFEFDTFLCVLDLPQKGHGREAYGLPEEPYRPRTAAPLVRYNSVKGTLLLCFLARATVSMVRYEMSEPRKRSTKSIIDSLQNSTVAYIPDRKQATRRIYSNFEALNSRIIRDKMVVSGVLQGRKPLETTGNGWKT